MKKFFLILCIATCCLTGYCDRFSRPPVAVTFRKSLIAKETQVLQLTNKDGSETVVLKVEAINDKMKQKVVYTCKIRPGNTCEVGCVQTGWTWETGERYIITADGYLFSIKGTVPKL